MPFIFLSIITKWKLDIKFIIEFFESKKWYVYKKNYRADFSTLPKNEQAWIVKINAMKVSDEVNFYDLLAEYEEKI